MSSAPGSDDAEDPRRQCCNDARQARLQDSDIVLSEYHQNTQEHEDGRREFDTCRCELTNPLKLGLCLSRAHTVFLYVCLHAAFSVSSCAKLKSPLNTGNLGDVLPLASF